MGSMIKFMKALWGMPIGWRIWLGWMSGVNMFAIYHISHQEAQYTLLALICSFLLGVTLFNLAGFTRLLGLMHFFWFALIPYLWERLPHAESSSLAVWIKIVIATNAASLIIDVIDVIRYILGDRRDQTAS